MSKFESGDVVARITKGARPARVGQIIQQASGEWFAGEVNYYVHLTGSSVTFTVPESELVLIEHGTRLESI